MPALVVRAGAVLIVVLWVVAILTVVCLALGGAVRFQQVHFGRDRDELTVRLACSAAAAMAAELLLGDGARNQSNNDI